MLTNQVEIGAQVPVCWKFPRNFENVVHDDLFMKIYWA